MKYKTYTYKKPMLIQAYQFLKGMESGWRIYYSDPDNNIFGCSISKKDYFDIIKFIGDHPKYKFDIPLPLIADDINDLVNAWELNFGDYVLANGEILPKEEFESLYIRYEENDNVR